MSTTHTARVTTRRRIGRPRYDAECSCGFSVGSFDHDTQATAAAEEHLELREQLGDQVDYDALTW